MSPFCAKSVLDAHDFQSVQADDISVEVRRYCTKLHITGTYLSDLLSLANGENGTLLSSVVGFEYRPRQVARDALGAAALEKPWEVGTHGHLIRSFAF